ncbi:MAG TPA: DUF1573 domain-containing protein [Thermoanaerobaculia bacterium]
MSDDFGTINVSRSERAREIEVMRQHYRRHRETLEGLIGDAPTEHLAQLYSRLVDDIDGSLRKLDELEGSASATTPPPPPQPLAPPTEPGMRPLQHDPHDYSAIPERRAGAPASRVLLILLVAFVGLALIGWLIWKASDRGDAATGTIADDTSATSPVTTETESETAAGTIAPAASGGGLIATPESQDFGVVRKGTRAVRKFTIRNETDEPAAIKISRSACRCLYYQHAKVIPPKNSETLSITIDGAKAKAGDLREELAVTTSDPSVKTTVHVIATIR